MKTAESPAGSIYDIEGVISSLLRWGVLASLLLLSIGTLLCFIYSNDYGVHGGSAADLQALIRPEAVMSFTLAEFFRGLASGQGQSLILAGLILLIATPVLRVAISVVTFAVEKDWIFVGITSVVLLFLLFSFFLGKLG